LEEWEAKCQTIEANSAAAKETIEVSQQDQLARHNEISEPDVMPFDRYRGVADVPRRFLWYREEYNVHAAKFNAGWSAADYGCKPASETSEEDDDDGDEGDDNDDDDDADDDDDDTDLSGHAPPSTIVDASTPHPRRSPRGLLTTGSIYAPSPSPTATVTESYSRRSRRQTPISPTEMSEEQADEDEDDDDDDDDANVDDSDLSHPSWKARLSQLADYGKIHGHCNVPKRYSESSKLATRVGTQRKNYWFRQQGKTSSMTAFRIQALESLGFEWKCSGPAWEDHLSELADYRKVNGHCNVPRKYSENTKLGAWVSTQRTQCRLQQEGKQSSMTLSRIKVLERLGFERGIHASRR
jgi:hypothetical protein